MYMRIWLQLLLICVGIVQARISVEFDSERIEANQNFTMTLVVPIDELPSSRGVPHIANLGDIALLGLDSTDEKVRDFFMNVFRIRKYHFKLKAPAKEGSFKVSIQWEMEGKDHSMGKVQIDVRRSMNAAGLEVRLVPSRTSVYEGEQFGVNLQFVAYENYVGDIQLTGMDFGKDFISHRAEKLELKPVGSSNKGSGQMSTAKVAWLSPIRAGELWIPEYKVSYLKVGAPKKVEKRTANSYFSSFVQEPEKATAQSNKVRIQVKPLPNQGRPQNFNGLVGQYQFEAKVDRNELQVGEALTLQIRIKGNGKPGAIPDPVLPSFADFRSVPPESQVKKTEVNGLIWTERVLKIYLYPKKKGEFRIAPISFHWFDPVKGTYVEQSSPEFVIRAEKGDLTQAAVAGGSADGSIPMVLTPEQKEIETLGADILHIHKPTNLESQSGPYYRSIWYWLVFLLPALLAPWMIRWLRKRLTLRSDAAWLRKQGAMAELNKKWKEAEVLLRQDARACLALIEKALLDYLGAKHNRELQGLTRSALSEALNSLNLENDSHQRLLKFLDVCDQARFSPLGMDAAQAESLLQEARQIAESLQGAVK